MTPPTFWTLHGQHASSAQILGSSGPAACPWQQHCLTEQWTETWPPRMLTTDLVFSFTCFALHLHSLKALQGPSCFWKSCLSLVQTFYSNSAKDLLKRGQRTTWLLYILPLVSSLNLLGLLRCCCRTFDIWRFSPRSCRSLSSPAPFLPYLHASFLKLHINYGTFRRMLILIRLATTVICLCVSFQRVRYIYIHYNANSIPINTT